MMIRMHNRSVAILLIVAILMSLLSGCANTSSTTAPDVDTESIAEYITESIIERDQPNPPEIEVVEEKGDVLKLSYEWEDYIGDLETFTYGLLINELEHLYDVFPAYVELTDGTFISGIGYSDYSECYTSDDEEVFCFAAGFIPCFGETTISQEELESGLRVFDADYTNDAASFVLTYKSDAFLNHCVVYGQYLQYGVDSEGRVTFNAREYVKGDTDESLGSLYSYDSGRYIYDLDVGEYMNISGVSLASQIDYDDLEAEINRILEAQDQNFVSIDIESYAYFAQEAVCSYLLSLQEETFLGYNVSQLVEIAQQLDPMECVRITDNGLSIIDLEKDSPTDLTKWLVGTGCAIVAAVGIVGSIVFIECPPLSSLAGAAMGTAIEIFMQVVISNSTLEDVNWTKVGLAAATGAVSGFLGPYIMATYEGAAYFFIDSALDGLLGGIEKAVAAWIDGEEGMVILESFGYGFALGFGLSAGFKIAGKVVGKILEKAGGGIAKLSQKIAPKLTQRISNFATAIGSTIYGWKAVADASIFHSKYIADKLATRQLQRLIAENSDELVDKAFKNLQADGIMDVDGNIISKDQLRFIFQNADDDSALGFFKIGDDVVEIVKKNSVVGIVFDPAKYQTVELPRHLTNKRDANMEEAAKILKKNWLDNPDELPESLADLIKKSGIDLEDMEPNKLVDIIKKSDWVLHENIDLSTVTLVLRTVHDKAIGGISHVGGYALAKYLKMHMGIEFLERFLSAASTGAVIGAQ